MAGGFFSRPQSEKSSDQISEGTCVSVGEARSSFNVVSVVVLYKWAFRHVTVGKAQA